MKNSEVFSIIADETKDVKKREQTSLEHKYYYNGAIQESFLHSESTESRMQQGLVENNPHIGKSWSRAGVDHSDYIIFAT